MFRTLGRIESLQEVGPIPHLSAFRCLSCLSRTLINGITFSLQYYRHMFCIASLLMTIWAILVIELTIRWNGIYGVNELPSTSQLIPFVIGLAQFLTVMHSLATELIFPEVRSPEDDFAQTYGAIETDVLSVHTLLLEQEIGLREDNHQTQHHGHGQLGVVVSERASPPPMEVTVVEESSPGIESNEKIGYKSSTANPEDGE